jgi:hypothetical protein
MTEIKPTGFGFSATDIRRQDFAQRSGKESAFNKVSNFVCLVAMKNLTKVYKVFNNFKGFVTCE